MKILAVDDNPSIRKMITTYFKLEGDDYQVETAENGALAIDAYEKFKPDIVIMDISMPVMDGKEALTRILKIDPNAAVIMATASGSSSDIDECMKKGARGHVEKPFSPEELLSTIKNMLKTGSNFDKYTTLFSRAASKMESSLRKMTDDSIILTLSNVDVAGKEYADEITYAGKDYSQVKRRDEIKQDRRIEIPEGSVGITCDVEGQRSGIIVASINKQSLRIILTGDENAEELEDEEASFFEIFNILNNNLLAEFSNYTEQKITLKAPRLFDSQKDSNVTDRQNLHLSFEITAKEKKIPLEMYMALSA